VVPGQQKTIAHVGKDPGNWKQPGQKGVAPFTKDRGTPRPEHGRGKGGGARQVVSKGGRDNWEIVQKEKRSTA